ncbi:DUF262 domain-containing protein [Brevibacterium casei]|uniref:DUF262 domain-containing protein n=1 Tax=Brevibacterium casei TaxID=33889 RepID=UPI00186B9332|nr:DUF262 domain-containing protein [Brevibacterium casei]MBE4695392.1 DUF262 domain-containing protein [Brevibacterium casei]MBY3578514.1 DUF262 domain-containing protein [Brevibacterium casei]
MIQSVDNSPVHELLSTDSRIVYKIPPYQREYSWNKQQWDALFDDLVREDVGDSHFLGTIICLNSTQNATQETVLELIDGQQRLTTLSLLLLAIYSELDEYDLEDDDRTELSNLRRMLVLRRSTSARLRPQKQNYNNVDYLSLLSEAGIDTVDAPRTAQPYRGNRRMSRCLTHFRARLWDLVENADSDDVSVLLEFLDKVKDAVMVKLEVNSASDAFTLFESLNNRGLPLTPIDLIKNTILAQADRVRTDGLGSTYQQWSDWMEALGDDYSIQERFFRHFYNAFKHDPSLQVKAHTVATRPKLMSIYDTLIHRDFDGLLSRLDDAIAIYAELLDPSSSRNDSFSKELRRLSNAQGAAAYMLLLALRSHFREELDTSDYAEVTRDLVSFFVRRNLTNYPPTYAIDRRFSDIAEEIANKNAPEVASFVRSRLRDLTADDEEFREALHRPLYEDNSGITRFILAEISDLASTRESRFDLWERREEGTDNKLRYVWTVEHILPQSDPLPQVWIDMLGGKRSAWEIQQEYVHTLGNLTITGYNSTLSNKGFIEKRDRVNPQKLPVGYKNGLPLNEDLASAETWSVEQIRARTERLAELAVELFSLDNPVPTQS